MYGEGSGCVCVCQGAGDAKRGGKRRIAGLEEAVGPGRRIETPVLLFSGDLPEERISALPALFFFPRPPWERVEPQHEE